MNTVMLVGHLTRDPEIKATKHGECLALLRLAVERSSNRPGRRTDVFTVVCFGHQGRLARDYLHQGRLVAVEARLAENRWGRVDIVARRVTHLDSRRRRSAAPPTA